MLQLLGRLVDCPNWMDGGEKDENAPVLEPLRDGLLLAAEQDAGAVEVGLLLAHGREGVPL